MRNSTLCYIERDGCYLMMHRVKKKNDQNHDKWIGIGGGFLEDESPEDCIRREAMEETGLTLGHLDLYSIVTFVIENGECEQMFLFKCEDFEGEVGDCDEGELVWVKKEDIYNLDLWEGDFLFLRKIETSCNFFTLKLVYNQAGTLLSAIENGEKILK